jgi:hypothetical protein
MEPGVLRGILDGLAQDRAAGHGSGARLIAACVNVLNVTGAGIMLMVDDEHRGSFGGSDGPSRAVEELQFTLGEGPCIDSYRTGQPVLEPHLADPSVKRWPQFSGRAVNAGIQAIFAFPLHVGAIRIGAVDLYSIYPGDLDPEQFKDGLIMADVIAHAVLEIQAGAAPGSLASELDQGIAVRMIVHQAAGMVSAQLDVPIIEGMKRLRTYAATVERPMDAVARQVVARDLRIR